MIMPSVKVLEGKTTTLEDEDRAQGLTQHIIGKSKVAPRGTMPLTHNESSKHTYQERKRTNGWKKTKRVENGHSREGIGWQFCADIEWNGIREVNVPPTGTFLAVAIVGMKVGLDLMRYLAFGNSYNPSCSCTLGPIVPGSMDI
ncbi:unnamed protein product [Dovyalis caffra]|uniref:Transposase n=1 Tax=Dovyalis caffra TaxID=77055 RepID=A0AAV1QYU8_9ROSI|nr:unnamed protein product [Dovyalis caffra]